MDKESLDLQLLLYRLAIVQELFFETQLPLQILYHCIFCSLDLFIRGYACSPACLSWEATARGNIDSNLHILQFKPLNNF